MWGGEDNRKEEERELKAWTMTPINSCGILGSNPCRSSYTAIFVILQSVPRATYPISFDVS